MNGEEEVLQLKKTHFESEKRMEEIGKEQFSTIIEMSEWLGNLIENIESTQERGKELENAAVSPRIKLMKKSIKLSKELKNLEEKVVKAFDEGKISKDTGKKFAAVTKAIKKNKISLAKEEFGYFEEIMELSRTYENAKEEFEKKERALIKEKARAGALLEEIRNLEKETVARDKVKRYGDFLKNIETLESLRKEYISTLASKPVLELLDDMENDSLEEYSFPSIGNEKLGKLRVFISVNAQLKNYNVGQICELFNSSEKKLMHICPVSEFRQIVAANKKWFETVRDLKRTDFLTIDDRNEKTMKFYSGKIDNASSVVEQITRLQDEKDACRKEYERNKRIEKRKKELSKYSKDELEKEMKEAERLLELLHSKTEERNEATEGKEDGESSLLSKIRSFFE